MRENSILCDMQMCFCVQNKVYFMASEHFSCWKPNPTCFLMSWARASVAPHHCHRVLIPNCSKLKWGHCSMFIITKLASAYMSHWTAGGVLKALSLSGFLFFPLVCDLNYNKCIKGRDKSTFKRTSSISECCDVTNIPRVWCMCTAQGL